MGNSIPIDPNRKEVCNVTSSAGLNGQPGYACVALNCDCFRYILDNDLQTRGRAISGHRANAISWRPLLPDNRNARRTYGAVCIRRFLDSPVGYVSRYLYPGRYASQAGAVASPLKPPHDRNRLSLLRVTR